MSKNRSKRFRYPSKTYKECPCCNSPNLIRLAVDALCSACDWTSVAVFVDSGGMDNLFAAHHDHFTRDDDKSFGETVDAESEDLNQKLTHENISA